MNTKEIVNWMIENDLFMLHNINNLGNESIIMLLIRSKRNDGLILSSRVENKDLIQLDMERYLKEIGSKINERVINDKEYIVNGKVINGDLELTLEASKLGNQNINHVIFKEKVFFNKWRHS